jgi:FKBP-type peptidyl-prolyl cis-trans isomerase (trigger factor)
MHDEFKGTLARQGITEEAYLKAVEKTTEDLHGEFRPSAERRAKTLLVLSKVADVEGLEVRDADVDAEVARGQERYAGDARLASYFESDRGRAFIRSTLRRSRVVERIIDEWLAAHPDHPALPHLEDAEASAVDDGQVKADAAIGAPDPDATTEAGPGKPVDEPAAAG